jgi:splicing factor 3A subunit 2
MADRQNRVGSKIGGAGVAGASESNVDRRERLRKLALETIGKSPALPTYLHYNH